MEEVIPPHFKMLKLEPCDGTIDPLDHLGSYKAYMMIQGTSNALIASGNSEESCPSMVLGPSAR